MDNLKHFSWAGYSRLWNTSFRDWGLMGKKTLLVACLSVLFAALLFGAVAIFSAYDHREWMFEPAGGSGSMDPGMVGGSVMGNRIVKFSCAAIPFVSLLLAMRVTRSSRRKLTDRNCKYFWPIRYLIRQLNC
jgi:hypothetical protein